MTHLSGGAMGERERPLGRSIGLEQEFFLVEDSGEPSVRADEFLERCRETSERESDGGAACLAPEWVKGVVEVNTPPVRSLADLERKYANNVGLALRVAREIGLRLYPLGTYPLPLEPTVREDPDYRVQVRTVGPERFMDAGRCAGTHLHIELPAGTVDTEHGLAPGASESASKELLDLHNLATALDPALIFLSRYCPFYEGRATGLSPEPPATVAATPSAGTASTDTSPRSGPCAPTPTAPNNSWASSSTATGPGSQR